jgi:hypothetical protein
MGRYLRLADQVGQSKRDISGTVTQFGKKSAVSSPPMTGETADARKESGYDKNDINDQSPRHCPADIYDRNDKTANLSPPPNLFDGPDLLELFQQRAAIRQFEGRRPREFAERLAYAEIVEGWCARHPQRFVPGTCAGCRQPIGNFGLNLPDGTRVHFEGANYQCLISYGASRKRRAVEALAGLGLMPPAGWSAS